VLIYDGKFNGRIITHPDRLDIPLKRKKPTVYALWNDLFHEDVLNDFQIKAYNSMYVNGRHIFLVLTKRPVRMESFFRLHAPGAPSSQFSNIYHGLTVCHQQEADEKIPIFLQVPGKKFLSIEPMLGAIDFSYNRFCGVMGWGPPDPPRRGENQEERLKAQSRWVLGKIDAVIVGGETGPGARPIHPDWVRSVRDQCQAAGVPFFFKQWGEWLPSMDYVNRYQTEHIPFRHIHITSTGRMTEDGLDLRNGESSLYGMVRCGRNKAGRLLDGRTHDDLPWRPL
jgi:protein gp37